MLRRIIIIASLLGVANLISTFAITIAARYTDVSTIGQIGIIESTFMVMISFISFGLQLASTRDIANREELKEILDKTQSARFSLSIIIAFCGALLFVFFRDKTMLIFIASPVIALNADYALYGIGKPVLAAVLSFVRVLFPALAIILVSIFYEPVLIEVYIISFVGGVFFAGISTAKILKVKYFYKFCRSFVKSYWDNILLGTIGLSFMFMSSGIIYIAKYFYSQENIGYIFIGLKLYLLFIGVRRLIVQAYFKDLKNETIAYRLDQFTILGAMMFVILMIIFPETTLLTLFGEQYVKSKPIFFIFGLITIVSSITSSANIMLLLNNKDNLVSTIFFTGAFSTIITCIIFSIYINNIWVVPLSILLGEIVLIVLFTRALGGKSYLLPRIKFSLAVNIILIFPVTIRLIWGDNISSLVLGILLFSSIAISKYWKILLAPKKVYEY